MSVSLSLVPAAIAIRLVTGKSGYNRWLDSLGLKYPSNVEDRRELITIAKHAGYKVRVINRGQIAVDLDGTTLLRWTHIDGKWTAVFEKSTPDYVIQKILKNMNQAAGRTIFPDYPIERDEDPFIYPTLYCDGELLLRSLHEFGIKPVRRGDSIECRVENTLLIFRRNGEDSPFFVEIHNPPDLKKIEQYLSYLDDDYRRCLQAIVYEKLVERAADRNMTIESEEVLEDNSIVLTLNIRE